jgi:hypothetical protein
MICVKPLLSAEHSSGSINGLKTNNKEKFLKSVFNNIYKRNHFPQCGCRSTSLFILFFAESPHDNGSKGVR